MQTLNDEEKESVEQVQGCLMYLVKIVSCYTMNAILQTDKGTQ